MDARSAYAQVPKFARDNGDCFFAIFCSYFKRQFSAYADAHLFA